MESAGLVAPSGALSIEVHRAPRPDLHLVVPGEDGFDHPSKVLSAREVAHYGAPRRGLSPLVNEWRARNLRNLWRGFWRTQAASKLKVPHFYGQLWLTLHSVEHGDLDLGLASLRVVTDAGVAKLVACMNTSDAVTFPLFKFHGLGTGTTSEAAGDTALVTELTTEYATNSTRPTGTQTTSGSANVYRSVATISPDSGFTLAITEHGLFSAISSGTLWDRSKFAAVNLTTLGDGITATYDGTFTSGS